MVRPLSRGRFGSPALHSPPETYRGGEHMSMKKSYTPRGTGTGTSSSRPDLYSTPPRSPLGGGGARSTSRARFGLEGGREGRGDAGSYDYDEHRNPMDEGRSYGRSPGYGRSSSAMREQRYDGDDDSQDHRSIGGSSAHARDVLSKMRGRGGMDRGGMGGGMDRGGRDERGSGSLYGEASGSKPPLRRNMAASSPRRRLDLRSRGHDEDESLGGYGNSENRNDANISAVPATRYEVMGMKEELKRRDTEALALRREMDEMAQKKDDEIKRLDREMDEMAAKHEENVASVRSKLVATFKEDMQEMKTEWEEAFQRLKDESDTTQRALEMELNEAHRARADVERDVEEEKARAKERMDDLAERSKERMDDLAERSKEQLAELKEDCQSQMEDLKRSKEEDLERLRAMYEEHLESTKKAASDVEGELKEEIHVLLEENEKVKMHYEEENEKVKACYENLEAEMAQLKSDLDELNNNYQKAVGENLQWEKTANSYKEELDDVLDENDKQGRRIKSVEDELSDVKEELERMTSQYQRSQAEKSRFEKEYDEASKERDSIGAEYDDLLKKLDGVQEERALESRYTEALVNQRDNMNAIIENSQAEIEELKGLNRELDQELIATNRQYANLGKEFRLPNGDAATLREELVKAERLADLEKEFRLAGNGDDVAAAIRDELVRAEGFADLAKEFHLPGSDASHVREELARSASALRDERDRNEKMKERLETLGRERERYNATVKALKYDLKALHGSNVKNETSLQEHMRLLNEKWDGNESRLKQIDKLKSELEESIQLLEENAKEREQMMKEHRDGTNSLQRDLKETQAALIKMERDKNAIGDRLANYEMNDAKGKRIREELEVKCEKLEDRLAYVENELEERESRSKSLESDNRSLNDELDKLRSKKSGLEDALDKMEDVKKGLKKKLESAYFDLEETQRELTSIRHDHEEEMQTFEAEISKLSKQKDTIASQEEEIKSLKEIVNRSRQQQSKDLEEAQAEMKESFKAQLRLMEDKHEDQERRNTEYLEQKHKEDVEDLLTRSKQMERAMKEMERVVKDKEREMEKVMKEQERAMREQKESLDQKSMAEIKRRGEFAKQKQELEILRSKERHLETHVNQLEEHISKVVADYEAKLQSGNITTCSSRDNDDKVMKKQIRELEKKLEVSSAAMKQIGKSSLLMEKENERLKHDKNELKLKLKKLVDCAEKFSPK